MQKKIMRGLIYLMGMVILAFGITLNTKTGLGVSPIISIAYCVSEILDWEQLWQWLESDGQLRCFM